MEWKLVPMQPPLWWWHFMRINLLNICIVRCFFGFNSLHISVESCCFLISMQHFWFPLKCINNQTIIVTNFKDKTSLSFTSHNSNWKRCLTCVRCITEMKWAKTVQCPCERFEFYCGRYRGSHKIKIVIEEIHVRSKQCFC